MTPDQFFSRFRNLKHHDGSQHLTNLAYSKLHDDDNEAAIHVERNVWAIYQRRAMAFYTVQA